MAKYNDLDMSKWKEYQDIYTDTLSPNDLSNSDSLNFFLDNLGQVIDNTCQHLEKTDIVLLL